MNHRFYVFNDCSKVANYVSQIKTVADLQQLIFDIQSSGTNLTRVVRGFPGIWAIDCTACTPKQRHIFMNQRAFKAIGGLTEEEKQKVASFVVLED